MHAALIKSTTAVTILRVQTPDCRLLEMHFRVANLTDSAAVDGSNGDARLAVGIDVTALVAKAAAASVPACPPPTTIASKLFFFFLFTTCLYKNF